MTATNLLEAGNAAQGGRGVAITDGKGRPQHAG